METITKVADVLMNVVGAVGLTVLVFMGFVYFVVLIWKLKNYLLKH